jgi:hypothetical protein
MITQDKRLRWVHSIGILFWGYQCTLLEYAVPIALVLEARFYVNRRWQLQKSDFYRTADLTSFGFIVVTFYLFLNRANYPFLTTLIEWLPIVLFPLATVIAYSTRDKMSLDILFYSLRKQREPVNQSWNMNFIYLGVCLVASATNVPSSLGEASSRVYFFPIAATLVILALLPMKSARYQLRTWVLTMSIIFLAANFTHQSIRGAHLAVKDWTQRFIANYIRQQIDPLRTKTSIGSVGKLKLSDSIVFRIKPDKGDAAPRLLQEAIYDTPTANGWMVINSNFDEVPHSDDFEWSFSKPASTDPVATIYYEFRRDTALVPVPQNLTRIIDLPAINIRRSLYGAVQGLGLVPSPAYKVSFGGNDGLGVTATAVDTFVPPEKSELIARVLKPHIKPGSPLLTLQSVFKDYRYSLYQKAAPGDALEEFLLNSKAGHCEYFASATVLMLRELGIPARYVVGFAVQEYEPFLDMFVVRQRHAHAWAQAYIDGKWQVVDTTPSIWAQNEADEASFLRPVIDLFSNSTFAFQIWWNDQNIEDYETELYLLGSILGLFLLWRIFTSEQVSIKPREELRTEISIPGSKSPFYQVEEFLSNTGLSRLPGETFSHWVLRINQPDLNPILKRHNRWRFDPEYFSLEEQRRLAKEVEAWLQAKSLRQGEKPTNTL